MKLAFKILVVDAPIVPKHVKKIYIIKEWTTLRCIYGHFS